jgi:hypothetical protein
MKGILKHGLLVVHLFGFSRRKERKERETDNEWWW